MDLVQALSEIGPGKERLLGSKIVCFAIDEYDWCILASRPGESFILIF